MSEHIFFIVWIGVLALVAGSGGFKRRELVCGQAEQRFGLGFALLVFIPIVWEAGHRGWFADTSMYIKRFMDMPSTLDSIPTYLETAAKDKGFYAVSIVIKSLITADYEVYLTIFAAFQAIALVLVFRKYSSSYLMSVFLFIASTDCVSWMYNGLRQFLAVTLIFMATPLMLKKKYVPLLGIILLASTLHQSALLMIPFVVIAQGEAWNKRTLAFIAAAILAFAFVGQFTTFLDEALVNTQYTNVVTESAGDDGTNPLRVAVYCVPAVLSFVGRRKIRSLNNKLINFCTNMSIISAGLYLVSMVAGGIFFGRLPIYVSLYGYILLPWEIDNLFPGETRDMVRAGTILCYLMFYYVQMHLTWGYI